MTLSASLPFNWRLKYATSFTSLLRRASVGARCARACKAATTSVVVVRRCNPAVPADAATLVAGAAAGGGVAAAPGVGGPAAARFAAPAPGVAGSLFARRAFRRSIAFLAASHIRWGFFR